MTKQIQRRLGHRFHIPQKVRNCDRDKAPNELVSASESDDLQDSNLSSDAACDESEIV